MDNRYIRELLTKTSKYNINRAIWTIQRKYNIVIGPGSGCIYGYNDFKPVNINVYSNYQETCTLHIASYKNDLEIVRFLLESGADINQQNRWGMTSLMIAAREGNFEIVKMLICTGADVNLVTKGGKTSLIFACLYKNSEIVKILLAPQESSLMVRSNVNHQTTPGNTALFHSHDVEIVRMLLDSGADINIQNKQGDTPLTSHGSGIEKELLELLLAPPESSKMMRADINHQNKHGKTTLMYNRCSPGNVKFLLEKGADPNIQDYHGKTVLTYTDKLETLEVLLKGGVDVNFRNKHGMTSMMYFCIRGDSKHVNMMLASMADVNLQDMYGNTALIHVVSTKYTKIARILLRVKGIDVNIRNKSGETALMVAQSRGMGKTEKLLSVF